MRIHQYLYTVTGPGREEQSRFLGLLDEQVAAAKAAGFAGVWMPEHHAARNAFPPPFPLLSYFAGRHRGLTLGTHIALAPLYHPLHLAEAIATLDWLNGGNTIFGFGSGFRPAEFNAFGVELDQRFAASREVLKVVDRLLCGERATFAIGPWTGADASLSLRPAQDPRPVLLWAAATTAGVNTGLACADGLIPNLMSGMRRQIELLDAFDARRGSIAPIRPVTLEAVIAPSAEEARQRAAITLGAEYASFKHWQSVVPNVATFVADPENRVDAIRDQAIVGTVDDVLDVARTAASRGVTDLILRLQHAETGQADVLRAIDLIGRHVITRLKDG